MVVDLVDKEVPAFRTSVPVVWSVDENTNTRERNKNNSNKGRKEVIKMLCVKNTKEIGGKRSLESVPIKRAP